MWKDMFDMFGIYGIYGIVVYVSYRLFYRKSYLFAFWICLALNTQFVRLLKNWIKEPRPNADFRERFMVHSKYGMPSGHAQLYSYAMTYYWFTQKPASIHEMLVLLFFYCITVAERYMNNKHSISQLVVGTVLGVLTGYISYWMAHHYLKTGSIMAG
jgi:membrane-associated phospholipid phosphatase